MIKKVLFIIALSVIIICSIISISNATYSITQLTNNSYYDDTLPQINSNGYVVWSGYDGTDWEIYLATPDATPGGPTITVCPSGCDFTAIQSAINAATNGNTIIVSPGTYTENINFNGKAITVRSEKGAGQTIINGGGNGSVVTFTSGEGANSILEGFTITGNINADPLFVNPANGDYHLQTGSPAIDRGINTSAPAYGSVVDDIEGTARPQDGDGIGAGTTGDGSDYDIGAYEYKLTAPTTYTLTITKGDTGSGTVTSLPAGINCGADCSEAYNTATAVTLTPTPDTGSYFSGWSGDADCSDGSVTMDIDKTCTALFTLNAYNLNITINPSNGGTVTAPGINCPGDCTETYNYGTNITLTAAPNTGYTFNSWTNCDSPSGNQCTMTMNSDKGVTANFTPSQTYTLAIGKSGEGSVTVVSSPAGINCGADCQESYGANTVVTLTATPAPGSTFSYWGGNEDCSDGIVTMDSPNMKTCWAVFDTTP